MYIGASDLCNRIVINMDQDLHYTRLWDIKAEYSDYNRLHFLYLKAKDAFLCNLWHI